MSIQRDLRVFFWEITVKIPSQKKQSGKSNLQFPGKILLDLFSPHFILADTMQVVLPPNASNYDL